MKKVLVLLFIAFFSASITKTAEISESQKEFCDRINKAIREGKNTITFKTDDRGIFELPKEIFNLSPVLKESLIKSLGNKKDQSNKRYITDIDIKNFNKSFRVLSSLQIPELGGIPAITFRALLQLMEKQIQYENFLPSNPDYIVRHFKHFLSKPRETLPPGRKYFDLKNELIVRRLWYHDVPEIKEIFTEKLRTPPAQGKFLFPEEERINSLVLYKYISLFDSAQKLQLDLIAKAVAKYIAQKYISDTKQPFFSENFNYLKFKLSDTLKKIILNNAIPEAKNLVPILELFATLEVTEDNPLVLKLSDFIATENDQKRKQRTESLLLVMTYNKNSDSLQLLYEKVFSKIAKLFSIKL